MPSPELKLKQAAEEIKEVLLNHDIAGAFALHTPGHGEFVLHLRTSYSCAYQYEDDHIRLYAKAKDFKDPEEQKMKVTCTSNMLKLLTDMSALNFSNLHGLSKQIDEKTNANNS